jgi:biopolymer transport protein ExbD/biopolymer transport protein TolR
MRRFSQRNALVTLSDINITPLLDLAFVLLIIFVITTPLLEQSLNLSLPAGGQPDRRRLDKADIRTVEISAQGEYRLGGRRLTLVQIESELIQTFRARPNLTVDVRADRRANWDSVYAVMDVCIRNGISQVSPRSIPARSE